MSKITTFILLTLVYSLTYAQQPKIEDSSGDVRLPLNNYNQLIENSKEPKVAAPATYAIGQSNIVIHIEELQDRTTATVNLTTSLQTFENKWSLIPLLPVGTAIKNIALDGAPVQLVQDSQWLSFSTQKAGVSKLSISYTIDARRSESGYTLPLPIPQSTSTTMEVNFPNTDIELSIIPSTNLSYQKYINSQEKMTVASANIPTTTSVLISWRVPAIQNYVISRAMYTGFQVEDVMTFEAEYDVELYTGESVKVELMSNTITLNDISVDDKTTTIINENEHFNVMIQGRGRHKIKSTFQAAIIQQQGPPQVSFPILRIPISQFELNLTGKKDVTVISDKVQSHKTFNQINEAETQTLSKFHIPLASSVILSWVDATPKDLENLLRANANIYHSISAEEGVLYAHALIDYEITHGETTSLVFSLPANAQVNRINSPTAGVSDWSVEQKDDIKTVTVFLDRAINSNYQLQVEYEQLLSSQSTHQEPNLDQSPINVPLIEAKNMHRQRGIVALLAGAELTLKPIEEINVTRVGENQLPAFFRNQISLTIAHTFKYTSDSPKLLVNTIVPEKKQGKYDAQVDTLVSLGEVSMRGSSSIQIEVKSGVIIGLQLQLPKDINILNVTGPSLRNHKVTSDQELQIIDIEFTQEMTGQFRLEMNYEKILGENKSELEVPSLQVIGTEVQHGRIAVEALTAVEVKTADAKQLSTLDLNELPQQLVLKTTNPILLAFKYVNTKSPHSLKLSMTRHQEINVQVAAIETAEYQTLITDDGLSVTTAKFNVRNSRRQFLRLNLPEESEVWSVFVDGKAEKPAMAKTGESNAILIKMLNSVSGFEVEVVYATPISNLGMFGTIKSQLPLPDMVVTHTKWDVFLPTEPIYQKVHSNLQLVSQGQAINPQNQNRSSASDLGSSQPLRINVPQQGIKYSFEKLYANQSNTLAYFEIRYSSSKGNSTGQLLSVFAVILIWVSIWVLSKRKSINHSSIIMTLTFTSGVIGLLISKLYLNIDTSLAFKIALVGGVLFMFLNLHPYIVSKWKQRYDD